MIKFNNIQILVSDKLNIMYEAIHMDIDCSPVLDCRGGLLSCFGKKLSLVIIREWPKNNDVILRNFIFFSLFHLTH